MLDRSPPDRHVLFVACLQLDEFFTDCPSHGLIRFFQRIAFAIKSDQLGDRIFRAASSSKCFHP